MYLLAIDPPHPPPAQRRLGNWETQRARRQELERCARRDGGAGRMPVRLGVLGAAWSLAWA
jgi:hypothetical protein